MADPYIPFAVFAALSATGAFVFEDASLRARIGLGPAVAEAPYGISGEAFRPKPAPLGAAAHGATIVEATIPRNLPSNATFAIVSRARQEVEQGVRYDASYRMLPSYPNGDIPADRGACTDLVVRAFRSVQVDLQVLVHEDMVADPAAYGGAEPDANVDHRRVPTLFTYFGRNTISLPTSASTSIGSFQPGDVVFYAWKHCSAKHPCAPEHVALVSNEVGTRGLPLVIQNGGPRATEVDVLDHGTIVGHFRFPNTVPRTTPAAAPDLNTPPPTGTDEVVAAPVPASFLAGPKHRRRR